MELLLSIVTVVYFCHLLHVSEQSSWGAIITINSNKNGDNYKNLLWIIFVEFKRNVVSYHQLHFFRINQQIWLDKIYNIAVELKLNYSAERMLYYTFEEFSKNYERGSRFSA